MDGTEHHTGASAVVLVARIGLGICVVLISAAIFWRATAPLGTVTAGTGTVSCGSALSHDGEYTGQFPECQLRLDDAQRQLYALDVLWLMSTIGCRPPARWDHFRGFAPVRWGRGCAR